MFARSPLSLRTRRLLRARLRHFSHFLVRSALPGNNGVMVNSAGNLYSLAKRPKPRKNVYGEDCTYFWCVLIQMF